MVDPGEGGPANQRHDAQLAGTIAAIAGETEAGGGHGRIRGTTWPIGHARPANSTAFRFRVSIASSDPGSLGRLHVISHGQNNQLVLGGTVLTSRNVGRNADWLRQLGSFLAEDGDILLYGCNLAADAAGQRLVRRLADLTGADVAASTNVTFEDAISRRSDWILEDSVGSIAPGYQDLLTGFDWTGQLGSSAFFNDGILSILGANGTFSISGDLGADNTGNVTISGNHMGAIPIPVSKLASIEITGQQYTIEGINLDNTNDNATKINEQPSPYNINLESKFTETIVAVAVVALSVPYSATTVITSPTAKRTIA
jgi:hypothetical protein